MESSENSNSEANSENAAPNNAERAYISSSSSPKRYKLDPNVPQPERNTSEAETANTSNASNASNADTEKKPSNADDHDNDVNTSSTSSRFAKRNYRTRFNSQSSNDSTPPEQSNSPPDAQETENNENNNQEENNNSASEAQSNENSDDSMSSSDSLDSESDSERNDDSNSDSDSSDTQKSAENEVKTNQVLDKPLPKCDLDLLRNLVYRQSGMMYRGERRTYDAFAHGLVDRVIGSIYSVERMTLLDKLEKHNGCVNCLNFNKAGNLLVTGSDDLKVIVWNWAKGQPITTQTSGHSSNVFQAKFLENGTANNQTDFNLITSARDGEVRQIQITPDGTAKHRSIVRHDDSVHKITIPEHNYNLNEILTAGEDGAVMRSDLREEKANQLLRLQVNNKVIALYSIASSPLDPEFCICGRDKFIRVYDKRNVKDCLKMFCPDNILKQKKSSSTNITCAVYNYSGSEILASYGNENIYLFDTANTTIGHFSHMYYGHKNRQTIKGVNFYGPNSEFIMSGSDCGNIFMWDKNTEAIVQWLKGDESGVVNCLESHPNFPVMATSGLDHNVKVWSPMNPNGRPVRNDLKKCIKDNLHQNKVVFLRHFMRNISRLVIGRNRREDESSGDLDFDDYINNDDDDDDDSDDNEGAHIFYRPGREPCGVQ